MLIIFNAIIPIINGYENDRAGLLIKFRKISSLESLEKLFDHLNYSLTDTQEIVNMYRAADHRRAELVSGGKLFDVGQVPKSVWRFVQ
ncbi:Cnu protein [Klebsiella pneumoniae]|uniref:Cnu protein n=1 Tax=Klebsiella pneumoniae TaxID=573 RepID=A0A4P0Y7J9_KLEPN|nr:Cnu protein [Klebsiella pneumoniae]